MYLLRCCFSHMGLKKMNKTCFICAGFRVAGGWGKVWMMAVWRGSWWESWWLPALRTMRGCAARPRCSSPRGWWGGLLPSRQTANQVSYSKRCSHKPYVIGVCGFCYILADVRNFLYSLILEALFLIPSLLKIKMHDCKNPMTNR